MRRLSPLACTALAWQVIGAKAAACPEHGAGALPPAGHAALDLGWTWDPWLVVPFALSAATYTLGVRRLWRHAGRNHGVRLLHVVAFAAGLAALVVALLSPLDGASDALFSAHMTQHELIMLVAAPLLVAGRPWLPAMWALPPVPRRHVLGWIASPRARRRFRWFTNPVLVLLAHGLTLWLWHLPWLFEAALESEFVHGVQHATFFATSALFFYALLHGRYGRGGYGVAVCFVFVSALHSGLLGALVTFARGNLYPLHAERTHALSRCAIEDQQLAGLIMWVPACAALLVVGLALFSAWLGEAERRTTRAEREQRRAAPG
jgi:putative membrane protein